MLYQTVSLKSEVKKLEFTGLRKPLQYVEGEIEPTGWQVFAIDPGVNFGIAVINDDHLWLGWGALMDKVSHEEHGINAYDMTLDVIEYHDFDSTCKYVLEGAAFNKQFGQVGLSAVRQGFYMGLRMYSQPFELIPPMTARKKAFGDGRQQAGDLWPLLNHNAADALGLALAAIQEDK
jgi:hypothetical protein